MPKGFDGDFRVKCAIVDDVLESGDQQLGAFHRVSKYYPLSIRGEVFFGGEHVVVDAGKRGAGGKVAALYLLLLVDQCLNVTGNLSGLLEGAVGCHLHIDHKVIAISTGKKDIWQGGSKPDSGKGQPDHRQCTEPRPLKP